MERPPKSKPKSTPTPKPEPSAAARALRLLAWRDHTRRELAVKLAPHVQDPAELDALLDDFAGRGWLSEARVVEQVVHAKRQRFGPARIRQALLKRGVSEALIAPALRNLKQTELEAARIVWAKKFRERAANPGEGAKQVRYLQARGFSLEAALRIVRRGGSDTGD